MTAALDLFFAPASIAIIGASDDPAKIGGRPVRYLRELGGSLYPLDRESPDLAHKTGGRRRACRH